MDSVTKTDRNWIYALWGICLWGGATVIFRLLGQFFFNPSNHLELVLVFVVTVPVIVFGTFPFYQRRKTVPLNRPKAALLIATPGIFLDVMSLLFFPQMFPNLDASAGVIFGAWLLWAYGLILVTGVVGTVIRPKPQQE